MNTPSLLHNPFERVVCVSLDRRPERWEQFLGGLPSDWPFGEVERFPAIDGKRCPYPPDWWTQGGGAWGCFRSWERVIEDCLNRKIKSILMLEDDAICCNDFVQRWQQFYSSVPNDWEILYLGGQHLEIREQRPIGVNSEVYIPHNVNRTHAWALRGDGLPEVYKHLCSRDFGTARQQHIDSHMGRLVKRKTLKAYCPKDWLVAQREGKSDVNGRNLTIRWWPSAGQVGRHVPGDPQAQEQPGQEMRQFPKDTNIETTDEFVAIIGLHSSGSSALAGVLHNLGVHMGNRLFGKHTAHGYEAEGLARLCERAIPFPSIRPKLGSSTIASMLSQWMRARQAEASTKQTIAGGKYPLLCALGKELQQVCPQAVVIHCARPYEESLQSLVRRERGRYPIESIETHLKWLERQKKKLLRLFPEYIEVTYDELLESPACVIERLVDHLALSPTPQQLLNATSHINLSKRHVKVPA